MELLIRLVADGSLIIIALAAGLALLLGIPNNRKFKAYSRILMAGLTCYFVAKVLGLIYQPADLRPFELMGTTAGAAYLNNPGFPSDHALFATFLTLAVWFETRYKKLALGLLGLTILMSIGRVAALVHTPLDVIGGMLIALVGIVWYDWRPKNKKNHTTTSHKKQK